MNYTVLARKYRPQSFEDLVGQEHVSKTLQNAIVQGRLAHAFLLTGARGVGKTTSARILAKALNCEKGPTPTPCNICASCVHIALGTDMDVMEMDGASHNSVDDVRRLQETIPFTPSKGHYRIIIIDEVHMLSQGAFNALLKTLEEPPAHIKFVFATTEVHKVPVTIRSRCQRFDFRLLPEALIVRQLRNILNEEKVQATDDALGLIAKEALGSMRDALTLTDLMLAQQHEVIDGDFVAKVLGVADRVAVSAIAHACLTGGAKHVFDEAHRLLQTGIQPLHVAKQLVDFVKQLVVFQISGYEQKTGLTQDEAQRWRETLTLIEPSNVQRLFSGLANLVEEVGRSTIADTVFEMGLVRLASQPSLTPIAELLRELHDFRQGIPATAGRVASPTSPTLSSHVPEPISSSAAAPVRQQPEPKPALASASVRPPHVNEPVSAEEPVRTLSWQGVVNIVRDKKPALSAVLEHAVPLRCEGERWEIGFPKGSFFRKQAEHADSLNALKEAIASFGIVNPSIIITDVEAQQAVGSIASEQRAAEDANREKLKAEALSHPAVIEAVKVFEGPEGPPQVAVQVDEP